MMAKVRMLVSWWESVWRVLIGPAEVDRPRNSQAIANREIVIVSYRIGAERYVFRYRPDQMQLAMKQPGLLAAQGGEFDWRDASAVTQTMRAVGDRMEAAQSATVL